jgi:hypothetical protein
MDVQTYGGRYFFIAILMNMNNSKNVSPCLEQTSSEQPRLLKGETTEAAALLQSLVNSPIMDQNYYLTTSNLCQAIVTIAEGIVELVDDVLASLEQERNVNVHYLEWTKERIWQIRSLSEVIDSRQSHEDFEKVMEMVNGRCACPCT